MSSDHSQGRGNAVVQLYRWVFGIGYERNVGGVERTVRYTLGGVCLLAAVAVVALGPLELLATTLVAAVLALTGAYLVYEARVQYCPLNHRIGRSTYADPARER